MQLPRSNVAKVDWPRWREAAAQKILPVPEAVVTVLCTPDDGWGWHPKHVEWTCWIINRLLCVASRWTIFNVVACFLSYCFILSTSSQIATNGRGCVCKSGVDNWSPSAVITREVTHRSPRILPSLRMGSSTELTTRLSCAVGPAGMPSSPLLALVQLPGLHKEICQ